jgi:hypothetical protein
VPFRMRDPDTIAEPQRGELKAALKEYFADSVTLLSREGRDQIEPLLPKVSGVHERMWRSAITATQDNAPLMAGVLPPINEVIELHSSRFSLLDAVYGAVLAAALWMTIDMDYPGAA